MAAPAAAVALQAWQQYQQRRAQKGKKPHRGGAAAVVLLVALLVAPPAAVMMVVIGGAMSSALGGGSSVDCAPQIAPVGASGFIVPMEPGSYTITSGFGARWGTTHRGLDLAAPPGTPIRAAAPGKVVRAGPAGGFGQWIVINHQIDGKMYSTVYGHMWPSGVGVRKGQRVRAGQVIGAVGSNGQSTGPHLHFEIWPGGRLTGSGHAIPPKPELSEAPVPEVPTQEELTEQPEVRLSSATQGSSVSPQNAPSMRELTNGGTVGPQSSLSLKPFQMEYVRAIVGVGKGMGLPPRAWTIAVATAMTESRLLMYANSTVPRSLSIPHDAVGSDHDSVGLFQQRPSWGTLRERMDAAKSARAFYEALQGVPWQQMPLAAAAQAVQRSAFPDAYAEWEKDAARAVLAAIGAAPIGSGSVCGGIQAPVTCPKLPDSSPFRAVAASVKPDAQLVLRCVAKRYPQIKTMFGRSNGSTASSDHPSGNAVDIMIPNYQSDKGNKLGDEISKWLINNAKALGIKYLIWDARIWFPGKGWSSYSHPSGNNDTLAHRDHVHVSVKGDAATGRISTPSSEAEQAA